MFNLSVLLEDSAKRYADKDAYRIADKRLSFKQVNALANQVANGLWALGIQRGDKVAMTCLNIPQFPILYYGILKAGAVVVPLNPLLKSDEIAFHLEDSDAKVYCCFQGTEVLPMGQWGYEGFSQVPGCEHFFIITADLAAPSPIEGVRPFAALLAGQSPVAASVQTEADDVAVIIYTSGTTGRAKGAQLTHANLFFNASIISNPDLLGSTANDVQIITLPLFHIFGMTVLMNAGLYRGVTSVLIPRFAAEDVLKAMQAHDVTIFAGVPTMYWALIEASKEGIDLPKITKNLRICASGGASLPIQVLENFEKMFHVQILEGYGMSEGSPVVTFNHVNRPRKPGSVGTPFWGVEVKLVDDAGNEVPVGEKGELLYRGHNVMKGYYKRPEDSAKTLRDGWLHSGDVAIKDEDGFFFIVDRIKDMIIRGGENVYPREVEEVMIQHPAVSLVAIIGHPDEKLGEEVKACVVLKDGHHATPDELREWTKERVALHKYPRIVEILPALPMNATGKILKKELRGNG
jgi:long-chain acyl-CoA synthetase